jgi:hypothetical protein
VSVFTLEALGGPWGKRLASRRIELRWEDVGAEAADPLVSAAREVWTRSAFSEYASGAAFAEIASSLLAVGAPIDLVAAAGEFVADEMFHAELSSQVAMALGGAVPLEVDLSRLVKPPSSADPLMRAAELVVRTCCVGEALTVPMLNQSRLAAGSPTIEAVITRILKDEAHHAQLGWWFLDWAELTDDNRAQLGRVAGSALRGFERIFAAQCATESIAGLGRLDCARFDTAFLNAVRDDVVRPLAQRGLIVPASDLDALVAAAA